jgi:hypothetical protein
VRERQRAAKTAHQDLFWGLLFDFGSFLVSIEVGVGKRPSRLAGFYKLAYLRGVFIDSGTRKGCNGLVTRQSDT